MGYGEGVSTHLSRREGIPEEGSLVGDQVITEAEEVRGGLGIIFTTISAVKLGYLDGGTPF